MENIKKILIIGSAGSGKTTFSLKLSEIINLPIIHLDREYWLPNWEKPKQDDWFKKVNQLVNNDEWIMDGNYRSSLDIRLQKADMVIFLDYKRSTCVKGVLKRIFKYHKKQRNDLTEGCIDKLDFAFLKWVYDFKKKYRPEIVEKLSKLNIPVVVFKNRKQSEEYLENLKINKKM